MPKIDIIIPTIPGREESLERCLTSYRDLAGEETNEIVIRDSKTCGWGWKKGLEESSADYVLLACDDQEAARENWEAPAIEAVEMGFIACPRVYLPNGVIESNGGDMQHYCHVIARPQKDWTAVDYTTIPFLSRQQIDEIGMIEVHYSSDVWVSYYGRDLGWDSVLRHGFDIIHHLAATGRGAGMEQNDRDAMDRAEMRRHLIAVRERAKVSA